MACSRGAWRRRVPLVPLIPILAILAFLWLMLNLTVLT
jgi:APA family basic amino acid/polyamine antiporter